MQIIFALLVTLLVPGQAQPPAPVAPEILSQFDFLDGAWDFTYTTIAPDGSKQTSRGKWNGRKLADGHVIEDSWVLVDDQGKPRGLGIYTFRAYNRVAGRWQYRSLNVSSGLWQEGTAEKVGSEMHLMQWPPKETTGGTMLRIRYYNITAAAFSWVADVSTDNGQTWSKEVVRIEAKRPR